MELILISQNKLKIMMTSQDVEIYELNISGPVREDLRSRRAFRNILAEAKQRTGFDALGERIYVQLYPSKCGGCEMFVTKLGIPRNKGEQESTRKEPSFCEIRRFPGESYYRFERLSDLLATCESLLASDYSGISLAYSAEENNCFFLMIEAESPEAAEFNGRLCKAHIADYITEHCRCICRDAVNILGTLF